MNEKLLNALMELFAIVANIDGITEKGRKVVEIFLRQQVTLDAVDEYLNIFDHYATKHTEIGKARGRKKKRTSVGQSVKALVICQQINAELTQKQKIVVLIRILEFVNSDTSISDAEHDFVSTMALAFNIEEDEYLKIKDYVLNDDFYDTADKTQNVLVVDNKKNVHPNIQHYCSDNLQGRLSFLKISSVDIYVMRYKGEDELYLNGQAVMEDQVYLFANGSTIRNPKINPIYYSDVVGHFMSDISESKITFRAEDVCYRFKTGKIGLRNIDLVEESGRLIGFMGASGAGKTTLLNVLSGLETPTEGKVTINGIDIHKEDEKIEGVVGYVAQDDLLMEELSVYQNLFYNAKLCFGDLGEEEINELVIKTLDSLGLAEIKDIKVGSPLNKKISGGQRKRLNIALELIREPSVLFVDEPTSGLSSRDSENIMDLLKELSLKGKLIFVVIHQPSSDIYKMFDKLLILDVGGYPIYYGNPIEAIIYFREITNHVNADKSECSECGNVNPEQIFNIIEAKVVDEYGNFTDKRKITPSQWNEFYHKKIKSPKAKANNDIPKSTLSLPSKFKQFGVFFIRDVLSKLGDTQYILLTFLVPPALAIVLAYFVRYFEVDALRKQSQYFFSYNENIPAYIFMSIVVALFIGLMASAQEIIKDRKIRKREVFLNLSLNSYFLSKVGILLIISAIQMLTFVLIGNAILDIRGMHFSYWLVLFSTAFFANMLGLNISSAFNSAVTIYILIPILLIPQLLLSGVIVSFDKLNPSLASESHVPLAGDLMTSKWAFEALAVTQFRDNDYEKNFYHYDKLMSNMDYKKNWLIPEIRSKIDYAENNYRTKNDSVRQVVKKNLNLVHSEMKSLLNETGYKKTEILDELTIGKFNPKVSNTAKTILYKIKKFLNHRYNKAFRSKDQLLVEMQKTPEEKKNLISLQKNYHNEELSEMVKNKYQEAIIEKNGKFIRKVDPIFTDPYGYTNPVDFRAHFYAPRKHFAGRYFDTFYFNVIIISLMSFILYITLYFDVFRKSLRFLGNIPEMIRERKQVSE